MIRIISIYCSILFFSSSVNAGAIDPVNSTSGLSISALAQSNSNNQPLSIVKSRAYSNSKNKSLEFHHFLNPRNLLLRSRSALIVDAENGRVLYGKNISNKRSIASLTKIMTAMVILDARLPLNKRIRVSRSDKDRLKYSRSRLRVGTVMRRRDLLYMALAASENRAAHALSRTYPGGKRAFVRAMNKKARLLGMRKTRFVDSSGLSSRNKSTARDLAKLVSSAYDYPTIQQMTTSGRGYVKDWKSKRIIRFNNTNRLVRRRAWDINISKTGYINESGYCLIMHTTIGSRPIVIVLLNSIGKLSKFGDANRIKRWLMAAEKRRKRYRKIVKKPAVRSQNSLNLLTGASQPVFQLPGSQ